MMGNRSVARLVRGAPSARALQRQSATKNWQIAVHPASQLNAAAIVKLVKGNPNLESWLTAGFSATGGSIALSPKLAPPPKTVPNEYLASLKKAFESGNWVLTTAELRITAKPLKDPPTDAQDWSWTKVTIPDLSEGEEREAHPQGAGGGRRDEHVPKRLGTWAQPPPSLRPRL
jgi:hypothetical protein